MSGTHGVACLQLGEQWRMPVEPALEEANDRNTPLQTDGVIGEASDTKMSGGSSPATMKVPCVLRAQSGPGPGIPHLDQPQHDPCKNRRLEAFEH